jgi:hypothetical protein
MDDLIEALVGSVVGIVFALAIGAIFLAGWLIYKFCELVLPPLFEALAEGCAAAERRIAAWWRELTWKRRMVRAHNETIRAIDKVRQEQVGRARAAVAAVERQQLALTAGRTTGGTAAVRSADRVAVRVG